MKELKTWWEKSPSENKVHGSYTEDEAALYIGGIELLTKSGENHPNGSNRVLALFTHETYAYFSLNKYDGICQQITEFCTLLYLKTIAICGKVSNLKSTAKWLANSLF